jgi:two-component system sensor histidine kinase CreC
MRLGLRILLCYLLVFGLGFTSLIHWVLGDLRQRYLEGVEEVMVDQANLLAATVGRDFLSGTIHPQDFARTVRDALNRNPSAQVYAMEKTGIDLQFYVVDAEGIVRFHSAEPAEVGADYSQWRDVWLTLRGQYGARSTRTDPGDPLSSAMHVAAPIQRGGKIIGALTLVKPATAINHFMIFAKREVIMVGLLAALGVFAASLLTAYWLTRPVRRLTQYATDVREGKRVPLPRLADDELGQMGHAFDAMREALEGKKYVEHSIQTLTHEIKSPLSAIRGAAELLSEPMTEEQRERFLANIRKESRRIQRIVDRLLRLSVLENRRVLETVETFPVAPMVRDLLDAMEPVVSAREISVEAEVAAEHSVAGDPFLVKQAVSNLLQNAVDFSPNGGRIGISSATVDGRLFLEIWDEGPGIPDYAREKIFDKFFSLRRPDTDRKSTGLGLNFVREVAHLHGGTIRVDNRDGGGALAILSLPLSTRAMETV